MLVPSETVYAKIKHLGVQDLVESAGLGLPQPAQYANQKATADAWGEIGSVEYHGSKKARYGNVVVVCVAELLRRAGKPSDIDSIVDHAISSGFTPSSADWRGRDLKKGLSGYVQSAIKRGLLVERLIESATYLVATSSGSGISLSASDSLNRSNNESVKDESDLALPKEVRTEATLVEGSVRRVAVNAYERSSKVRDSCISAHGSLCSICSIGLTEGDHPVPRVINIAASKVRQGALVLYTTSMTVADLVSDGFYSVETLDPDNLNDKGYQRLLNKARAKKLADYIVRGQDSQDAFLPTSVFLATDKSIEFDNSTNTIAIDIDAVGPFSVVDGQHRLEGLRMASEKDSRVLDFEVPVNIAINLPKIAQMCHFLIVNTTQKSVDKSVEQRIIARLRDALDIDDLPSLPKWIFNTVERGEVEKAVKYADYLNENPESPWHGKTKMANSDTDEATVNQRTFVKAIVKYILTANNPLSAVVKDFEKEKKIFLNYWKAIAAILDNGNAAVLYKYNGVELFCKFSIPFFIKLQDRGSFTTSTMEALLRSCFDNVEGEYAGVGHPDWWAKGSKASFLNAGAINVVSQEMPKALHKSSAGGAIEI